MIGKLNSYIFLIYKYKYLMEVGKLDLNWRFSMNIEIWWLRLKNIFNIYILRIKLDDGWSEYEEEYSEIWNGERYKKFSKKKKEEFFI